MYHNNILKFFFVFFLDGFFTDITPVTSSSSEIMKPFPTSEEKYMNVFFPGSPLNNEVLIKCIKLRITLSLDADEAANVCT
jgi:hypothetical protein